MKVGIVQVDGNYPNLALMQITKYHEQLGDSVEWYKGRLFDQEYGAVYASKIFSFSELPELPDNAFIGGTGIDFKNTLPEEIQKCQPSYTLYSKPWKPFFMDKPRLLNPIDYHVGFSMKGCRFNCKFCCVPQKEGRPKFNSHIDDLLLNPEGENRLMLLDNDFFGSPQWKESLERIIELKLKVSFVQGLNIRIITSEQAQLLSKCNYYNGGFDQRYLTFAWDKFNDGKLVMKGIKICNEAGIPSNKMQFFVLIGFDSTHEQNYERVMTLRELGCMPYVMPYNKSDSYQKSFARWVNNRAVFKSCSWEEYKYKKEYVLSN